MSSDAIGIGMIGCGTVGQGVVRLLHEQREAIAERVGRPIEIRRVLIRKAGAHRDAPLPSDVFTTRPDDLLNDKSLSIVVEVAGGIDPVGDYVRRALTGGRHVITANKALLAIQGEKLFALARKHNVSLAFEASCGGGIPILAALKFGLAANRIQAIYGILNGTCNYILTQMSESGVTYADALAEAQTRGFAEADPTLDVSGADAGQKLAIVASLAFGVCCHESDVVCEGIDRLEIDDIYFGAELDYQIRLLAIGEQHDDGLVLRVHPCFIHSDQPLAQVRLAFNALSVYGHAIGHCMFYGRGAGQMPTASAVVSDLLNVAGGWYPHAFKSMRMWPDQRSRARIISGDEVQMRFYLRIMARDQPGVMAQLTHILGDEGISISAVLQHEMDNDDTPGFVPVIITTHRAREGSMRRAIDRIAALDVVHGRPVRIRILDLPEG